MAESDSIRVQCPCGAKLKARATAAGRRVKCPKCGEKILVQAVAPAASSDDDLFSSLTEQEQAASTTVQSEPATQAVRPGFGAVPGARKAEAGGGAGGLAAGAAKALGGLGLGCVLSAVGAVIGAVVWYLIAMKLDCEIGYVAWGIGLLTGFGMLIGHRDGGPVPGILAALIALGSIVAAKVMIFMAIADGFAMDVFIKVMFDFIDVIFVVLAVATAFKVGAGIGSSSD
jgi:DNA-directed RNA polymerase subunit RPC12/RpoP